MDWDVILILTTMAAPAIIPAEVFLSSHNLALHFGPVSSPVKRQQCVWVAAPSDEVHSTQELLEVRQGSQGLGRLEGTGRVEVFSHSRTELKHIQRKEGDCLVSYIS